jgi:2-polyprenyl-3-methyl-5-hydroxy-6-metoxy-1,4-benzoquinol methylase
VNLALRTKNTSKYYFKWEKLMNGDLLLEQSTLFSTELEKNKKDIDSKFPWYPYGSLNNFIHLRDIFNKNPLESLASPNSKILDIGAADGDLSFFLESLGYQLDIIDNGPTNFNNLMGARSLKEKLNSNVGIFEIDIDSQFKTPDEKYDLIFFLGILYHLKNPFYILESLSRISKSLVLSTRVAKFTPDKTPISESPLAYLLAPDESNNDATNYWIFSNAGLKRLFDRTGWEIIEIITVGDTKESNPRDQNHDERAFALLRSKNFKRL